MSLRLPSGRSPKVGGGLVETGLTFHSPSISVDSV